MKARIGKIIVSREPEVTTFTAVNPKAAAPPAAATVAIIPTTSLIKAATFSPSFSVVAVVLPATDSKIFFIPSPKMFDKSTKIPQIIYEKFTIIAVTINLGRIFFMP